MINVINGQCEAPNCNRQPCFNHKNQTYGRFCSEHKETDMVDVVNKKCEDISCDRRPTFNYKEKKGGRFCFIHKHLNMVDVVNKRCEKSNCTRTPCFNNEGTKIGRFCSKHKQPYMVDVISTQCKHYNCDMQARYGIPGYKPEFCARHKTSHPGLIKRPRTRCLDPNCNEWAIYGITHPRYCETHHEVGIDINLVEQQCTSCGLSSRLNPQTQTCEYCNPESFKSVRLLKQRHIQKLFDLNNITYDSTDRIVERGVCGKERPDFLFDCGTHFLIVEVDEHQHGDRDNTCEIIRMINISQGLGMRTIFIRYNPDDFNDNDGCHSNIRDSIRHDWLLRTTRQFMDDPPKEYLQVVYLFFNGHDMNSRPVVNTIDATDYV